MMRSFLPQVFSLKIARYSLFGLMSFASLMPENSSAQSQSVAVPHTATTENDLIRQFEASLAPHFLANAPGATVLVSRQGKVIFRRAYGLANIETKAPMQVDLPLRIGSNTKQFTAVALMQLVDAGKLKLTDTVQQHLPAYPDQGKKITLQHLLTHTAGVRNYDDTPAYREMHGKENSVQEVLDYFKNAAPDFEPGERHSYSNTGYVLLGAIIEKITGMPLAAYMQTKIFQPLQMQHTSLIKPQLSQEKTVFGYRMQRENVVLGRPINDSLVYSAGAITSTVDDMALWDKALSEGALLSAKSWQAIFKNYPLNSGQMTYWGFGWQHGKVQGRPMYYHGGSVNGFVSHTLRMPQDGIYVVILSNRDYHDVRPSLHAERLAAIAIGQPYPDHKAIKLPSDVLDKYVGTYQKVDDVANSTYIVRRDKDQVYLETKGRSNQLIPVSDTEFWLEGRSFRVRFESNANQVNLMRVSQSGLETELLRLAK
nr:serine hydrolase [uncultured Undibacterium sp.]